MKTEERRLLTAFTALESPRFSQRFLARRLGLALGSANGLIRRMVRRRWVELSRSNGRWRYVLTATGRREKRRLAGLKVGEEVGQYQELRRAISSRLEALEPERRRIVLYGAGDVGEIAYIAVVNGGLELVGVVDEGRAGQRFFGHVIAPPSVLKNGDLHGEGFDTVVVTSPREGSARARALERMAIPPSRILLLWDP